jgi:hypothetical protein
MFMVLKAYKNRTLFRTLVGDARQAAVLEHPDGDSAPLLAPIGNALAVLSSSYHP